MQRIKGLSREHSEALAWFDDRAGKTVSWPAPLNGLFLVNKAKGIHKPKGFEYALSVRQSLSGPYEDAIHRTPKGQWSLTYAHEGDDPDYYTNRALQKCLEDGVPVGVLMQATKKGSVAFTVDFHHLAVWTAGMIHGLVGRCLSLPQMR